MNLMIKKLSVAAVVCCAVFTYSPYAFAKTAPAVPENIYEWVQSSPRMNYFFNKQEIKFAVKADGNIDINTLAVPVLKTYDPIQIEDVIEKRRWRMEPVSGLSDLAGEADYITIDLNKKVVTVNVVDLLDSTFSTVEHSEPGTKVELSTLSPQSREAIFYDGIMSYYKKHVMEIAAQTKGKLTDDDRETLEKMKKEIEKQEKKEKERLEKERKEQEEHHKKDEKKK